eukprot:gene51032-62412_t
MGRAQRRLLIQYPKRQVGNKLYEGQSSHLPLKLNTSGVIPPIFASSLLLIPATIGSFTAGDGPEWFNTVTRLLGHGQPLYMVMYVVLIVFFCFFYTAIVFNPVETADNLKKHGGFIPGIRPGERTAEYIDYVLTRITVDDQYKSGDLAAVKADQFSVHISVLGPTWINADTVTLYQNGVKIREATISADPARVEKASVHWILPRPAHDVYLVAIATGPGITENYWNVAPPYQPGSRRRSPRVIGATNPVWVDADHDGTFSAPRVHAERLLKPFPPGSEMTQVIASLKDVDES